VRLPFVCATALVLDDSNVKLTLSGSSPMRSNNDANRAARRVRRHDKAARLRSARRLATLGEEVS
ncbi:hypothetical protein AAHH78_39075, partial [Burkholderia pseudomallei]